MKLKFSKPDVSIQLVSPASGEQRYGSPIHYPSILVSIQLVSPASGESFFQMLYSRQIDSFHSIGFPSEWGVTLSNL